MDKKHKKDIVVTQKGHNEWHRKNRGYDAKNGEEHEACHREMGISVKRQRR